MPHRAPPAALVVVVGMSREARIVAGQGVATIVGGGRGFALAHGLERALRAGAGAVLSFGVCGGLDPTLGAGACVVATGVVGDGERLSSDPQWRGRLAAALPGAVLGDLAGRTVPVTDRAAKHDLHRATGAAGVDLESLLAAQLAARWGVPFAAVRTVSDPAHRAVPEAALAGFGPDGDPDVAAVLRALAAAPWELPAVLRTALEAEAAFRSLVRCRQLLGPGLGRPDLG
jgi:hopanoid-associated phosphorylase